MACEFFTDDYNVLEFFGAAHDEVLQNVVTIDRRQRRVANSAMNGAIGFARVRLYSNDPVLCLAGQTGELLPDVLGHEYPPILTRP